MQVNFQELEKKFIECQKSNKILIICGPTACGKTNLSLKLGEKYQEITIINIDAYQVYKDLPICSASPSLAEKQFIEHKLFNYLDYDQNFSIGQYFQDLKKAIEEVIEKNKYPILVGGSSLYIYSIVNGLKMNTTVPMEFREKIMNILANQENSYEYVKNLLPTNFQADFIERIKPKDLYRISRVLEFFLYCNKYLFDPELPNQKLKWQFDLFKIMPEKQKLYELANLRVIKMIEEGAIEEVKNLLPVWDKCKSIKTTLLAREIFDYLNNRISLQEATVLAQQNTRKLIKKQFTWLNNKI